MLPVWHQQGRRAGSRRMRRHSKAWAPRVVLHRRRLLRYTQIGMSQVSASYGAAHEPRIADGAWSSYGYKRRELFEQATEPHGAQA